MDPRNPGGRGTPIIRDAASANTNNPTPLSRALTGSSGPVVLASNISTTRSWHHRLPAAPHAGRRRSTPAAVAGSQAGTSRSSRNTSTGSVTFMLRSSPRTTAMGTSAVVPQHHCAVVGRFQSRSCQARSWPADRRHAEALRCLTTAQQPTRRYVSITSGPDAPITSRNRMIVSADGTAVFTT